MIEVPPTRFGPWQFNRDNLTLWLPSSRYEVDLEHCLKPADVLASLCDVRGKAWANASQLGHLVEGLIALLYGHGNPRTIAPSKADHVIRDNERVVLTDRRFKERMHAMPRGPISAQAIAQLESECRAEVDAEFEAAEEAEITEDLFPSGLSIGDVFAIGLANGECPVGRVGRGYGANEVVLYEYDWLTGWFGEPLRIDANEIREVRHGVLMTDAEKAEQGYVDELMVFNMDPLAEFQKQWRSDHGLGDD